MPRTSVRSIIPALAGVAVLALGSAPALAQTFQRFLFTTSATPGAIRGHRLFDGGAVEEFARSERVTSGTNPSLLAVWSWPTADGTQLGRILYARETDRIEAFNIGCDGTLGTLLFTIGDFIGLGVRGIAFSTNQRKLYAADRRRDRILAYDIRTPDDGIEPACQFFPNCGATTDVPCCGVPANNYFTSCIRGVQQANWEDMLLRTNANGQEILYVSADSSFVNDRIYTFTLDEKGDFIEPEPPKDDGSDSATTIACCGPNAIDEIDNPCCDPTDIESQCCDPNNPIVIEQGGCVADVTTTTSTSTTTTTNAPGQTTTTTEPECANCRSPQRVLRKKNGEKPAVAEIRQAGAMALGPNQIPADIRAELGIDDTGDVLYISGRFKDRIIGWGFTNNGVLTQERLTRTKSVARYGAITFSPGTSGSPGHIFGTVFADGRVDAFSLDAKNRKADGNPRTPGFIRSKPGIRTVKDLRKSPVRMTVDDPVTPTVLYVAAGLSDRVEAFRLNASGTLASQEPFSRTQDINNSFPNDVVVTTVQVCP